PDPVDEGCSGASRPLDLRRRIPEGAEDPVVHAHRARLAVKVRAHVLPHYLAVRGDLEDTAAAALADQGIAVGQSLRARDVRAEEVEGRLVAVFPYDGARA